MVTAVMWQGWAWKSKVRGIEPRAGQCFSSTAKVNETKTPGFFDVEWFFPRNNLSKIRT